MKGKENKPEEMIDKVFTEKDKLTMSNIYLTLDKVVLFNCRRKLRLKVYGTSCKIYMKENQRRIRSFYERSYCIYSCNSEFTVIILVVVFVGTLVPITVAMGFVVILRFSSWEVVLYSRPLFPWGCMVIVLWFMYQPFFVVQSKLEANSHLK